MKKLVVLTGAGMSAESGIPTFRDTGGLWEQYPVEDVASIDGFHRNPELVLEFYNERRRNYGACKPNAGHLGLAALEKDFDVQIITQNVDNLHEQAGSKHVLHLHGEIMKACSVNDTTHPYDLPPDHPDIHLGDKAPDGAQARPFIVWFGEPVPNIAKAAEIVSRADAVAIIGTSLNVYPAAGLVDYVPQGKPIFLIDPNETNCHRKVFHIQAGASEGVKKLTEALERLK
jgi:NAD-dependent deacetylase